MDGFLQCPSEKKREKYGRSLGDIHEEMSSDFLSQNFLDKSLKLIRRGIDFEHPNVPWSDSRWSFRRNMNCVTIVGVIRTVLMLLKKKHKKGCDSWWHNIWPKF